MGNMFEFPYLYLFIQLLVVEAVFLIKAQKRSWFFLRLGLCAAAFGAASFGLRYIPNITWIAFIIPAALNALLLVICYRLPVHHAAFFVVIAYSVQNSAYNVFLIIEHAAGHLSGIVAELLSDGVLLLLTAACWLLFVRNMRLEKTLRSSNIKTVAVCVVMLVVVYVLNALLTATDRDVTADIIARSLVVICVFFALWLVFGISAQERLAREKAEIEQLLRREESLHRISKENIDLINMKCHDLKHRIAAMRVGAALGCDAELGEIEDAIAVYDGFVKTGNEDLDIVLAEKSMSCKKDDILLSCIADGRALAFMAPGDVYSLFGNAFDNAIECLRRTADKDKRVVSLSVQARGSFVGVRMENYCGRRLVFEDGLPVTDKADKNYHGFGMKSIRYVAEKYDGSLFAEVRDDMFVLNIIFPRR